MDFELPPETFELPLPAFLAETCRWLDSFEWVLDDESLFHFVRAVKAHPKTRGLTADQAFAAVHAVVTAQRVGAPGDGLRYEDGEVAFHRFWERVRFPMGIDLVQVACGLAGDGLIRTNRTRPGRYQRFLTVAALLQAQVRQRPILLPTRKLAEHMPCQANTVVAWIAWAIEDGVLVKTKEHAYRSAGESRAAEYVFALHRWPGVIGKLAALIAVPIRDEDLEWIESQFDGTTRAESAP